MLPEVTTSPAKYPAIDAYVEREMRRLNVPGIALAIVEGDKITHLRGLGRTVRAAEPPSPQTPFFIGSLTKSFTALAVMQLAELGKIDLDAPVQRYLPWFRVADPVASAQMTVRHLLNQTSGLTMVAGSIILGDLDEGPGATERQVRALASLELSRAPGAGYEYSNANYLVLGLIVEAASGESYADYVQNRIFDPLQMTNSYTTRAEASRGGLAMGHRFWFWQPIAAPKLRVPAGSLPAGQLISSAEDMAHYLIAHMNGGCLDGVQVLSPEGMDALHRGAADVNEMGVSIGKYAMGWWVSDVGGQQVVWHSGLVPDFCAYMAFVPGQRKGIVLLLNADHFMMEPIVSEFGLGATALLAGEQIQPSPFGFVRYLPWAMRGLLLIPLLQAVGVAVTLGLVSRWRRDGAAVPRHVVRRHVLLPLVPSMALVAAPILLRRSPMSAFLALFMPDVVWLARISGGFAAIWAVLRTLLVLAATRRR